MIFFYQRVMLYSKNSKFEGAATRHSMACCSPWRSIITNTPPPPPLHRTIQAAERLHREDGGRVTLRTTWQPLTRSEFSNKSVFTLQKHTACRSHIFVLVILCCSLCLFFQVLCILEAIRRKCVVARWSFLEVKSSSQAVLDMKPGALSVSEAGNDVCIC